MVVKQQSKKQFAYSIAMKSMKRNRKSALPPIDHIPEGDYAKVLL